MEGRHSAEDLDGLAGGVDGGVDVSEREMRVRLAGQAQRDSSGLGEGEVRNGQGSVPLSCPA